MMYELSSPEPQHASRREADWFGIGVGIIVCFGILISWQRRFPDQ
jgi:hypothetical protein